MQIVAEFISGRLPWRSQTSLGYVRASKIAFPQGAEFRRLPRELRDLYR